MIIKNYTPHAINVVNNNDETLFVFPSEGNARCSVNREQIDVINSIPVNKTVFGEVEGLPEEQEGIVYIVSSLVAQALKGIRNDVLIPDDTVRDEQGRIIGCKAFARI